MPLAALPLGTYPTPVRRLQLSERGEEELWLKDDGVTNPVYGGNKVRKLEFLLAQASARGARELLTFGAAGSHHVFATSVFGKLAGFHVRAVLFPQPWSEHCEAMLRRTLDSGAECLPSHRLPRGVTQLLRTRKLFVIPPGGSSALGCQGYVQAGLELAAQVARGELPEPDEVVVSTGSGGTAAGLCVGLALGGLRCRVVAAPVMQPAWVVKPVVRGLVAATARAYRRGSDRNISYVGSPLVVDDRHTGRGYGWPSSSTAGAIELGRNNGLVLDPTYTAKAFATAVGRAQTEGQRGQALERGFRVLYWHTLSAAGVPAAPPESVLPTDFQQLLIRN